MKTLSCSATIAALSLGLAACGDYQEDNAAYANEAGGAAYGEDEAAGTANYQGGATATTGWPEGSRIIVEEGVAYRIEPGGARIRLGPNESRIVVEDGVRFRVDPDGARVRIDDEGAVIDLDVDEDRRRGR